MEIYRTIEYKILHTMLKARKCPIYKDLRHFIK